MGMSEYYQSLDAIARARYQEKLKLLGLTEKEDPYDPQNATRFVDDMTKWPRVEFGHIFCYYIDRPGLYTRRQLMHWKSLEAYNYFSSNHVRQVKVWPLPAPPSCILMGSVNPSQSSPDKAHLAWVGVRQAGDVVTLHCTCMAGLGEGCSHSAAILFKVECAVRNGYTSVTSNTCGWNQVFSTKHEPSRIVDINFSKPKRGRNTSTVSTTDAAVVPLPTHEEREKFFAELKAVAPEAAILSSCFEQGPQISSKYPALASLPPTIMSLSRVGYRDLDEGELANTCKKVFEELSITAEESNLLFKATVLQSESLLWFEHRKGRLTASRFGAICHTRLQSPSKSLVESILHRRVTPKTAAMRWGLEKEAVAREAYVDYIKEQHDCFEIESAGLYINPESPHLGASPDGLISCECCGPGLLEIKCPFSVKDTTPTSISYIKADDGIFKLCKKHNYYFQVQGQMAVFEHSYCDFVCWTPCGLYVERILYDEDAVNSMMPKLDAFFLEVILPEVLCDGKETENRSAATSDGVSVGRENLVQ